MKTLQNISFYRSLLLLAVGVFMLYGIAAADDLNPPPYRYGPLSVHVHWSGGTGLPGEPEWWWVDDNDPSTYLYPDLYPHFTLFPDPTGGGTIYEFTIPNAVDRLPLKLLRIQVTWLGSTQPPIEVSGVGFESGVVSSGVVTYASQPHVYTQPSGGYQYFDIEFRPNPDFEILRVHFAPNTHLVQVVIDSISTVPEPSTVAILALGSLALTRVRRRFAN